MNKVLDRIKLSFEENPLGTIAIGALAVTAIAKLIDASASARNTRTWQKEVDRRVRKTR